MLYFDYDWDLSPGGILLDAELNTDKLNWQPGDVFVLERLSTGKLALRKQSGIAKFILESTITKEENTNG